MFGEDRFSAADDFSIYYQRIDGRLPTTDVNNIIMTAYHYLETRYPDEQYRHNFPSVETAILETFGNTLPPDEILKILDTFTFHELGSIPEDYVNILLNLKNYFTLAVVIDIWSDKKAWLDTFKQNGIDTLFSAASFSSDHGIVKPSPEPFELIVKQLKLKKEQCLVAGDSPRRDLGGAISADIDCVLVGGAQDPNAFTCYTNLIEFYEKYAPP